MVLLSLALCASAAGAPRRIVSLSPNVTELLYGIGAFSQVVGVSDYCTYPPEASKLPSVGGWANPSLEKLAALGPDLVIVDDGEGPFVEDSFRKLGLKFMVAPTRTVEDVYRAMAQLGQATGPRTAGRQTDRGHARRGWRGLRKRPLGCRGRRWC